MSSHCPGLAGTEQTLVNFRSWLIATGIGDANGGRAVSDRDPLGSRNTGNVLVSRRRDSDARR